MIKASKKRSFKISYATISMLAVFVAGTFTQSASAAIDIAIPSNPLDVPKTNKYLSQNNAPFKAERSTVCTPSQVTPGGSATNPQLPPQIIQELDSQDVINKINQNKERYLYAEKETGLPWQISAVIHFREAGLDPNKSMADGSPLTAGKSKDGLPIDPDPNIDAAKQAQHFIDNAQLFYQITITSSSSQSDIGTAFLAYNRGGMYKTAGLDYTKSGYVMRGIDSSHIDGDWVYLDPFGGHPNAGKTGNANAGALAVLIYISDKLGLPIASGGDACFSGPGEAFPPLGNIDPNTLPMPKGNLSTSNSTSDTIRAAKILYHLFPSDFSSFTTYNGGVGCHIRKMGIDMMIDNYIDSAVRARIEKIAEYIMTNRVALKVTNIIYYDKSFRDLNGDKPDKPYASWNAYGHPSGTQNDTTQHRDHIHISISPCDK